MRLPEFAQAIHYRELRGGKYRFELLHDVALRVPALEGHRDLISLQDRDGREWALIDGERLVVRRGYAWNGASPKWWVLLAWIGTPDFEATRLASLFHDVCFQFLWTADWPEALKIPGCNDLFYEVMRAGRFRLAGTYHGAVRIFGARFAGTKVANGERSVVLDRA